MSLTAKLRKWRKSTRITWERWRYAFTRDDLLAALRRVGIANGDVIMVHSAADRLGAFRGTAIDVIETLKQAVGPAGVLMMPTIPFTGTAVDFVRSGQVFDVRRTPSRVGLLTELFRRSPGVQRSVHPTHSVAVWGERAGWFVAGHSAAETPCGAGTPYSRLAESNGKIVLLGVPIDVLTFFHTIEAELEREMPFSPFTKEIFEVTCRDGDGNSVVVRTRLFEPAISRRRSMDALVPELKRNGDWKQTRVGNVAIVGLPASACMGAAKALAARGVYCYV